MNYVRSFFSYLRPTCFSVVRFVRLEFRAVISSIIKRCGLKLMKLSLKVTILTSRAALNLKQRVLSARKLTQ